MQSTVGVSGGPAVSTANATLSVDVTRRVDTYVTVGLCAMSGLLHEVTFVSPDW
jgi:hypothetical protein